MFGGPRISTSQSRHRRIHSTDPQHTRLRSVDTTSDHIPVDRPDVNELRRARAEFYNKSPEDRRREAPRVIEHQAIRRKNFKGRQSSARLPDVVIREERRKHESERRHRRRKPKEEVDDDDDVYVYRHLENDRGSTNQERPRRQRSVSTTISRDKHERVRVNGTNLSRSTGRRALYSREETSSVRSERRPSSDIIKNAPTHRPMIRNASVRGSRAASASGGSLKRSQTAARKVQRSSFSLSTPPIAEEKLERRRSNAKKNDRPPGFLGAIFSLPKPAEAVPEKQVECLTCLSDVPVSKSAKLACQHSMCHACLRRIFNLSVTDPQHMPPKCCTQDHIPLKHVDKLFDIRFKKKWNQKYQEYTTKNRIYCPAKGCGDWIKPSNIYADIATGRKYGKCSRCRTKVCTTCNGKWHTSRDCPKDEATQRFAEIAKQEGWQRCFNCSATVELKEGCNHMTCRCGAEFCMICALKWKSCDCPWFNYAAVEADRLLHMNVPRRDPAGLYRGIPPPLDYPEVLDHRHDQERRDEGLARRMANFGYGEMRERYHDQERRDEDLARRMANIGFNNNFTNNHNNNDPIRNFFPHPHPMPPPPPFHPHPPNRDFVRRTADILSPPYNPIHPHTPPQMPDLRTQPPLRHHNSATSRIYARNPQPPPPNRAMPRPRAVVGNDYEPEAAARLDRLFSDGGGVPAPVQTAGRRHSALAGLNSGTAEGRVDEWRRHVGDD